MPSGATYIIISLNYSVPTYLYVWLQKNLDVVNKCIFSSHLLRITSIARTEHLYKKRCDKAEAIFDRKITDIRCSLKSLIVLHTSRVYINLAVSINICQKICKTTEVDDRNVGSDVVVVALKFSLLHHRAARHDDKKAKLI